ncbi:MAG: hypothetical protein H6973_10015 [Gammaproteobacteria bacterium]|nr:hypothetical protein [Gammaproteobacteria bacterium]HRX69855.1 type III-B CRISPR module-associated Cmr3 family protein [Candidatus Competibacteraceae bacterium]
MNNGKEWRFESLDSWFFREARPFNVATSNELSSVFPPPARAVAGAVRTLIGETQGVDWERFARDGEYAELKRWIGACDDLGDLKITGPYPLWEGKRLYPAPLHLLAKGSEYVFLQPGAPVECDLSLDSPRSLGEGPGVRAKKLVRLPTLEKSLPGAKPLENAWLNSANLQQVLCSQCPEKIIRSSTLYDEEPRLGIARNNAKRTVADGLLYQTRHHRPRPGLGIGVTVSGIPSEQHPEHGIIRFGGEGRPSAVTVDSAPPRLATPIANGPNVLLVLLTPADFGGDEWLLPGFKPDMQGDVKVWRGQLNGVDLVLHCAVLGKAVREGGWDLLHQRPRPVRSLIPAGSVYFCTVQGNYQGAIDALHGQHIGHDTALGRGELAIGSWKS